MTQKIFSLDIVADILSVSKKTLEAREVNGKLIPTQINSNGKKFFSLETLLIYPEFKEIKNSNFFEETEIRPNRTYKSIELFAGAGGLALGIEKAGFEPLMLNEINKNASNTLQINRPNWNVIREDIKNLCFLEYKDQVDLLSGGFPCQPFSYAGKSLGFEDTRGTVFFEFARAIKEINPRIVLIENVKGLKTHDKGRTLTAIKDVIKDLGYLIIEEHIYKALFYKVPQKRERLIIIAARNDIAPQVNFKRASPYPQIMTLTDAFKSGKLYDSDVPVSEGQEYSSRKKFIMSNIPEGGYWKDLPISLQKEYMKGSFYLGGGKTGMARRLSWSQPSLTLTTAPAQKQTERCHPSENRPLTIREYARIQTFPDCWEFSGSINQIYHQIGNAVPINMAEAIAKSIIRVLNSLNK